MRETDCWMLRSSLYSSIRITNADGQCYPFFRVYCISTGNPEFRKDYGVGTNSGSFIS